MIQTGSQFGRQEDRRHLGRRKDGFRAPARTPAGPNAGMHAGGGFTLLEVIVAILIACGLLVVVLFYYRQAAQLRDALMFESSRITTVRLVMERITSDLRTALPGSDLYPGLTGASNEIRFSKTDMPVVNFSETESNFANPKPLATVKIIQYRLSYPLLDTNLVNLTNEASLTIVSGGPLEREETAWTPGGSPPLTENSTSNFTDLTNEYSEVITYSNALAEAAIETNAPVRKGATQIKDIGYLRFRFWDTTNWVDSWNGPELPTGVEVSLGFEPPPEEVDTNAVFASNLETSTNQPEVFQRIIFLPLAKPSSPVTGEVMEASWNF